MKRCNKYFMEHCNKMRRKTYFIKLDTAHIKRMIAKTEEHMKKNPPPICIADPGRFTA